MLRSNSSRDMQKVIVVFVAVAVLGLASAFSFRFIVVQFLGSSQHLPMSNWDWPLAILFGLFGGWLSDRIGRPATILIAASCSALLNLMLVFEPEDYRVLAFVYTMSGAFGSMIAIPFWAFIAENASFDHRGLFFALVLGFQAFLGQQFEDIALSYLNRNDFARTVTIGAFFAILALAPLFWLVVREQAARPAAPESEVSPPNRNAPIPVRGLVTWLVLVSVISGFGVGVVELMGLGGVTKASRLLGLTFQQNSVLIRTQYAFSGTALMLCTMLLFGWLSDLAGERRVLTLTMLLIGAGGTIPFLLRPSFGSLVLQAFAVGFCDIALGPGLNSILSKILPDRKQGIGYGLFSMFSSLTFLPFFRLELYLSEQTRAGPAVAIVALVIAAILAWTKIKLPAASVPPVLQVEQPA